MPKEKRSAVVSVLVRPEEKRDVQARAEAEGMSLSTLVRRLLLEDVKRAQRERRKHGAER